MKEHTLYALQSDTPHLRLEVRRKTCFLISMSLFFSTVILKLMVKITSISGSYRFLRIAWRDIFSLSDQFPVSWNLYIPRDVVE